MFSGQIVEQTGRYLSSMLAGVCLLGLLLSGWAATAQGAKSIQYPPEETWLSSFAQIDISGEKERQVIIDHVRGLYLGHPDTVLLEDNRTILVVYPIGHGGPTVLKRSEDGGLTWSKRQPVPPNWGGTTNVPTIFRMKDAAGLERLVVLQNMPENVQQMLSGQSPDAMFQAVSLDNGATWTPFAPTGLKVWVVPNTMVQVAPGEYLTVYHRGNNSYMAVTKDGGLTWTEQGIIARHQDARMTEPAAVTSPDGSTIAVLIRESARKYNSMLVISHDKGKTWSEPVELPPVLTGDRHMPVYAPDGRLVITFRDSYEKSPTYGDFVAWVGTFDDLVNLRPGQYRVRLLDNIRDPGDTGYAGLEVLPDGTMVSTTYHAMTPGNPPNIATVSVRYKMEELDARLVDAARPFK